MVDDFGRSKGTAQLRTWLQETIVRRREFHETPGVGGWSARPQFHDMG
jgi:hypothetical protein